MKSRGLCNREGGVGLSPWVAGVWGISEACWELVGLGGSWCVAWEPPKRFLSCRVCKQDLHFRSTLVTRRKLELKRFFPPS